LSNIYYSLSKTDLGNNQVALYVTGYYGGWYLSFNSDTGAFTGSHSISNKETFYVSDASPITLTNSMTFTVVIINPCPSTTYDYFPSSTV
jgi:hypothetical protein